MRIIFVVPRFHTNLSAGINALVRSGCDVSVIAESATSLEDHSHVKPVLVSSDSRDLSTILADLDPQMAIVRRVDGISERVIDLLRKKGTTRIVIYTQVPRGAMVSTGALEQITSFHPDLPVYTPCSRFESQSETAWTGIQFLQRFCPAIFRSKKVAHFHYFPLPVEGIVTPLPQSPVLRILLVAKLWLPRKNHLKLIEALEEIAPPDGYHLTLVGSKRENMEPDALSNYERILEWARKSNGLRKIEILENLCHSDMPSIYMSHHICVLPSVREPLGTAPLEAMAHGRVPVISKQAGSSCEIIDGVNGLLVDMERSGNLARVLRPLFEDRELVERLAAGAAEYAQTRLAPDRFVKNVRNLYDKL